MTDRRFSLGLKKSWYERCIAVAEEIRGPTTGVIPWRFVWALTDLDASGV